MKIFKKWLGIEDQSKLVEDKFQQLQDKIMLEVTNLRNEKYALQAELTNKNERITELLGKVREQNEADLLLECKRTEKRILDGEKITGNDELRRLISLQSMYANQACQQMAQSNRGALSALSQYGGGIFR